MENKTNKNGKKEKILKGVSYVGAAGVGALGAMAFTTPESNEVEAEVTPDNIAVETSSGTSAQSKPQTEIGNDTIVAELTDEQVAKLKENLREEIKEELLHDEDFIHDVRQEIVAELDDPAQSTTDGQTQSSGNPEIEVLDYATVTAPDGSTADIATMKVDDTHVAMIDVDQDNFADVMVIDSNHNLQFDQDDYAQDVTGQGMAMSPLCEAAEQRDSEILAGDGEPIESTDDMDFVNNADTTNFLA